MKFMNLHEHCQDILNHFFDDVAGHFILPCHCVSFLNAFLEKELGQNPDSNAGRTAGTTGNLTAKRKWELW